MKCKILKPEDAKRTILFSDNLRYILRSHHITYAALAEKIGVSTSVVCNYALGRSLPSEERIQQIATALKIDVSELFDDTYAPWNFGTGEEY